MLFYRTKHVISHNIYSTTGLGTRYELLVIVIARTPTSGLFCITILYLVPFSLHVLLLGLATLEYDCDAQDYHPGDHPTQHDAKVLPEVILRSEDDTL